MLTCLSKPTGGEAYICGHNVSTESTLVKKAVGVSPQDIAVAENLTVRENLELMAKIYGFTQEKRNERIADMQRMFKLDEVMEQRTKTLSGGWKRRVSIAMALISEPEVLFLDEPTLGLDVLARRELWSAIQSLKGSITVILTTHYMEEAEQLSDRIAIMVSGKLRAVGTLSELEALTGEKGLENAFIKIAEAPKGVKQYEQNTRFFRKKSEGTAPRSPELHILPRIPACNVGDNEHCKPEHTSRSRNDDFQY